MIAGRHRLTGWRLVHSKSVGKKIPDSLIIKKKIRNTNLTRHVSSQCYQLFITPIYSFPIVILQVIKSGYFKLKIILVDNLFGFLQWVFDQCLIKFQQEMGIHVLLDCSCFPANSLLQMFPYHRELLHQHIGMEQECDKEGDTSSLLKTVLYMYIQDWQDIKIHVFMFRWLPFWWPLDHHKNKNILQFPCMYDHHNNKMILSVSLPPPPPREQDRPVCITTTTTTTTRTRSSCMYHHHHHHHKNKMILYVSPPPPPREQDYSVYIIISPPPPPQEQDYSPVSRYASPPPPPQEQDSWLPLYTTTTTRTKSWLLLYTTTTTRTRFSSSLPVCITTTKILFLWWWCMWAENSL